MRGQCWSENQDQGCSNCGGPHPLDQCRHPDKILSMPNHVSNPQQQAHENMRGARPHGEVTNDLRPLNFYYDHGNARQTFHPPAGLQTSNGYISIQRGQAAQPPKDPDPSNSQDVRFMDSSTISLASEVLPTQVAPTEGQGHWPPQVNSIMYELRSLDGEVVHKAPTLAVTIKAMRGNMLVEIEVEEQEENPLGDVPYFYLI